jgi:ADP-ribose pyrophosphatase YjhB (NUDIX family)
MRLPHDPAKRYFYVEHPTEGWRVFLRGCCFIHEKPEKDQGIDYMKFVVVKRTGAPSNAKAWEPPKGQMEGKDGLRDPSDSVLQILTQNVKREVAEESRIRNLQFLSYTGLVLEGVEKDYPPNTFFQYHVFHAVVTPNEFRRAAEELVWYREHPDAFARLKRDKKEKDEIRWYSPSETRMMGRWSPTLVGMYLKHYAQA